MRLCKVLKGSDFIYRIENDTLILDIAAAIDSVNTQTIMSGIDRCIFENRFIKNIRINLSSIGGSPNYAIALYNYLRSLGKPITTVNTGFAESSAVIVFLAGDKRLAYENTTFLIHGVTNNFTSNTEINYIQAEEVYHMLSRLITEYNEIFKFRTQLADCTLNIIDFLNGKSQIILPPEAALKHGIIHEIIIPK